ncbi:MAG: hypothetical protein OXQ29_26155 [Rhodospirillaceae bacterium]|nr:hypothetical protein [Rhodospirillaceae bacterium]
MSDSQSDSLSLAAPTLRSLDDHPMDPRRGPNLSPRFAALLCWLLDLPAMTEPAIVAVAVTDDCVFAATTDDPSFNLLLGSWRDCQANLRGWGQTCEAPADAVEAMIETLRLGR